MFELIAKFFVSLFVSFGFVDDSVEFFSNWNVVEVYSDQVLAVAFKLFVNFAELLLELYDVFFCVRIQLLKF